MKSFKKLISTCCTLKTGPLIVLLVFICFPSEAQIQDSSILAGVYLTADDVKASRLAYSVNCDKEQLKIRLHDFMERPYFDVYKEGQKLRLRKDSVFGYKDCKGTAFRFN